MDILNSKILIADDAVPVREVLSMCLKKSGAKKIEEACDKHEAIEKIKNTQFDLIICDLLMPDNADDGFEVVKEARQSKLNKSTPILIITGGTASCDYSYIQESIAQKGASAFLLKPINFTKLFAILKQI